MKFSDKLAKMRKANNLSQEQLADQLGVTRQSVSKWESGDSYPDMAKIIQICKILNCTLFDIMDDGVLNEEQFSAKEEENKEEKYSSIKKYFNAFLDFVTRSVNMFFQMSFKARLTMIIEMAIIVFVFYLVSNLVLDSADDVIWNILNLLPESIYRITYRILKYLLSACVSILGIIICVHIYKIRYLDYYVTLTDKNATKQTVEEPIKENEGPAFNKDKEKVVIIRDPEHSGSKVIDFLVNLLSIAIKIFLIIIAIPTICVLVCCVGAAVFCLINGGLVLISGAIGSIGIGVLAILIVIYIYNVLFSRKHNHLLLICLLVVGLLLTGSGLGLFANGVSKFNVIHNDETIAKTSKTVTLDNLNDSDTIYIESYDIEFVIDENKQDITMEFTYPKDANLHENSFVYDGVSKEYYYHLENDLNLYRVFFDDIKNGEIRDTYNEASLTHVKVTCNSKNKERFSNIVY